MDRNKVKEWVFENGSVVICEILDSNNNVIGVFKEVWDGLGVLDNIEVLYGDISEEDIWEMFW